jgi:hypothetical protein
MVHGSVDLLIKLRAPSTDPSASVTPGSTIAPAPTFRVLLHKHISGTEAKELGWDRRTHQMLTGIIVVYRVDARPMRDVCKVLETCLGSNKDAVADVRVLVIGNPCSTNCLITMNNAKEIPRHRWFAMTRLDENRARAHLAHRAGIEITRLT